jgi:alpha-L-fucosidase
VPARKLRNSQFFFFQILPAFLFIKCTPKELKDKDKTTKAQESITPTASIEQWGNDKLSLFVYFGVYSYLEGRWNQKEIKGPSEEIWARSTMLTEDYERTARQFEPGRWDAETVAKLVLDMGMQSVIITAKHYDGFCMFATKTTPFNILDFTSYDKDIINEMAKACKTYNLNLAISFPIRDDFEDSFSLRSQYTRAK